MPDTKLICAVNCMEMEENHGILKNHNTDTCRSINRILHKLYCNKNAFQTQKTCICIWKETVFDNDSSLKDYITEYSLKKENENVAENKNEVSKNTEYETEDYENIIEEAEYKSDYDRVKDRVSDVITSKIINAFEKVDLNALVSQIAGKTFAEKVKGTMMEMFLNESTISTISEMR